MRQLLESVYGQAPALFTEETPLRPVSVYGSTKAWGETQTRLDAGRGRYLPRRRALLLRLRRAAGGQGEQSLVGGRRVCCARRSGAAAAPARRRSADPRPGARRRCCCRHGAQPGRTARAQRNRQRRDRNAYERALRGRPDRRTLPGTRLLETPMPPGDPLGGYASPHRLAATLEWKPTITVADGWPAMCGGWARPRTRTDWLLSSGPRASRAPAGGQDGSCARPWPTASVAVADTTCARPRRTLRTRREARPTSGSGPG